MKQPELGIKLASLRKEKGITQQELADLSTINIRTVQRIESGEVTPRTFTVKQYLKALNLCYEDVIDHEKVPEEVTYKSAWIFGIIYFIVGFPEAYFTVIMVEDGLSFSHSVIFFGIKLLAVASYFFFIRGFWALGKGINNQLLTASSMLLMIGILVSGLFDSLAIFDLIPYESVIISESIFFGIICVLFGVALFRSEQYTGRYGILAGILEVMAGLTFLTIVFGFIGLFIQAPAEILEILILYFAVNKVRKVQLA